MKSRLLFKELATAFAVHFERDGVICAAAKCAIPTRYTTQAKEDEDIVRSFSFTLSLRFSLLYKIYITVPARC